MQYLWILFLLIAIYFIIKSAQQTAIFKKSTTKKIQATVVDVKMTPVGSINMFYPIYEYELDGELQRIVGGTQQISMPTIGSAMTLYYNSLENKIVEATLPTMYTTLGIVFAAVSVLLSFVLY